jgi:hypothetical protein
VTSESVPLPRPSTTTGTKKKVQFAAPASEPIISGNTWKRVVAT